MAGPQAQPQSNWMDMLNSPLGQNLAAKGQEAIQSGDVSEEDMQKVSPLLKAAGIHPAGLMKGILNLRRAAPVSESPVARGSGLTKSDMNQTEDSTKSEDSNTETKQNKSGVQNTLFMSPTQLNDMYTSTARLPAFQQQQEGLDKERDMLGIAAQAPTDIFSGPIAGLLKSQFPSQDASGIAAQAARETTPEGQRKNILDMTGKYQDDQRDMSKSIFDAIGKEHAGSLTSNLMDGVVLKSVLDNAQKNTDQAKAVADDPNKFIKPGKGGKGYDPTADLKAHQKRMEPMQGAIDTLNSLDQLVGGIDNWKGQSIPGVGPIQGHAPSMLLSDKGSAIQQSYSELKNELLKMYNGQRITDAEYRRLSQALGSGPTSSDREFIGGLKRYRNEMQNLIVQKETPLASHPETLKMYKDSGGVTSTNAFPKNSAPPPAATKRTKPLDQMTQAELDAYEAQLKGK